jgi:hypothetical protein
MQTPETEPAPFARGDRVVYRPRPAGPETVELIEYRREGWPGWYVRTGRPFGRADGMAHRYTRAEDFDPLALPPAPAAEQLLAVSRGRRLARCAKYLALFVLIVGMLYALNAITP